ncbi:hypothetical protein [Gloeobacter kilaueensis]|uniref:Uncharacterized protein n=1 Tax=Gloeobacter kilaueensis (strain ATCC BAA-2537 / CCAP 1431/1 / ULC 316 / JS1) TaxID=1183438 RepID=U5QLM2_GLOK1|nr:hypothetical protein [Gloeobacter kilaueensis]AGY59793.1 hypothetical protein GKIL_3547 [Gloeobacter kilaueensis JS1]
MKKTILLTIASSLLIAGAAWASKALQGVALPPVAADPPVRIDEVNSSLQDEEFRGPNMIWDTTIALRNTSAQPIDNLELELTMADVQGTIMTRLSCPMSGLKLLPNTSTRKRLRELYLAWPGVIAAAQVKSVVFADGSRWPAEPAKPSVSETTSPDPARAPSIPATFPARSPVCTANLQPAR